MSRVQFRSTKFFETLVKRGCKREALLDFYKLIGAPKDPPALCVVTRCLRSIIPYAARIAPTAFPDEQVRSYIGIIDIILGAAEDPHFGIHPTLRASAIKRSAFYGLYSSNPLYCALGTAAMDSTDADAFTLLKAQVLVAAQRLLQGAPKDDKLTSTFYNGCLGARQFGRSYMKAHLQALPAEPVSPKSYLKKLETLMEHSNPQERHPVAGLARLIERSITLRGDSRGVNRLRGLKRTSLFLEPAKWKTLTHTEGELDQDISELVIGEHPGAPDDEEHEAIVSGDAPGERLTRAFSVQIREDPRRHYSHHPTDTWMRQRGFVTALAMRNQALAIDFDVLQLDEINLLIESIEQLRTKKDDTDSIPNGEIAALLAVILWSGFGLDTSSRIIHCEGVPKIPIADGPPTLFLKDQKLSKDCTLRWQLPVNLPQRKSQIPLATKERTQVLELPVPTGLSTSLFPYLHQLVNTGMHSGSAIRLFPRRRSSYREQVKIYLSDLRKVHHCHFTLRRVEQALFRTLVNYTEADRVDAGFLTSHLPSIASNDVYYLRRSTGTLLTFYNRAHALWSAPDARNPTKRTQSRSSRDLGAHPDLFDDEDLSKERGAETIGSPFYPDISEVRELSRSLRERLISARHAEPGGSYLCEVHNVMAIYTLMFTGFSVGLRAVGEPLKRWTDIDTDTGLAVLVDKDAGDGYGTRLVLFPKRAQEQISFYRTHVLRLAERLSLTAPELQSRIYRSLKLQSPITPTADWLPPLFILDSNADPQPCTPSWIKKYLHDWKYPYNAHRHFLASQLRARGVKADIVCAFMGHWQIGEEPWAARSALSPLVFINSLSEPLNKIVDDSKWLPTPGLGARR